MPKPHTADCLTIRLRVEVQGILVSAFAKNETLTAAKESEGGDVVPKSVDSGRLILLIENFIGQSK